MYKSSFSFCIRCDNDALVFSSVMTLHESPGNFWMNDYMNVFLSSTVTAMILSNTRIWTTLGLRSAHDMAQSLSRASAHSSQFPGLSWLVSHSLKIQSHQKVAKLSLYYVIEIFLILRAGSLSKYHQYGDSDILSDYFINDWQADVLCCNCSAGS